MPDAAEYRFGQIHIDVARNSTDDFNPFHDPHRFDRILATPTPADRPRLSARVPLPVFPGRASAVAVRRPGCAGGATLSQLQFHLRPTPCARRSPARSSQADRPEDRPARIVERVLVKKSGRAVLLVRIRDTPEPVVVAAGDLPLAVDLRWLRPRGAAGHAMVPHKRSSSTRPTPRTSRRSAVDQALLLRRDCREGPLPRALPCALASCALLEAGLERGPRLRCRPDGVRRAPHQRGPGGWQLRCAATNVLHILARGPTTVAAAGLGGRRTRAPALPLRRPRAGSAGVYAADIDLAPLQAIAATRHPEALATMIADDRHKRALRPTSRPAATAAGARRRAVAAAWRVTPPTLAAVRLPEGHRSGRTPEYI